ncbi:ribonuclease D [Bartonella ancashensis]|uniref:Ribonuclease D related protein n=1 Tax=Bartonella ancashensis TaxID=1318743 RepID=A0A0M4LIC9_9HYPH|nr:ribonuclease D [Bartonella ancashensis]ALE03456.1 Ribonuclease D related protein [Bartonella ancashensis]
MTEIRVHQGDLPNLDNYCVDAIAVDTETLGLQPYRDRLCVVQLSSGDGTADIIQISKGQNSAPNLVKLLENKTITKIFHFGRFDLAILMHTFGIVLDAVFCTKIASKLTRTYTDRHGLKEICSELLNINISKQQQSSDWAAETLSRAQIEYAASDVLYLHRLKSVFEARLKREGREDIAKACFQFLPIRAELDLLGWPEIDIFAHS